MAYAMGRTPAKPKWETEINTAADPGTEPLVETAKVDGPSRASNLEAIDKPLLVDIEDPVDVRRLTGEWEKGLNPATKTRTTSPPPPKTSVRPRQISPKSSLAKVTITTAKIRTKELQQQPLEPTPSSSRRPSTEANLSPGQTGVKYTSRLTEAKAMMAKVRLQLNSSRNTSGVIKKEVMDAAERLLQLVKEMDADRRADQEKGAINSKVKDRAVVVEKRDSNISDGAKGDDHILEIINENNRMLRDNEKRMQEIQQTLEEQKENWGKTTYARVVNEGKKAESKNKINERKTLHSVIITSKDDQETGEEVLERVRKVVEAKEGWIKVEKVRKAKDRKIIMGCSTKEEREKIRDKIEKAGQSLMVEDMRNRDPLLVLKDVLKMHNDEEAIRALKNQNREVFHGLDDEENRIQVKYRKKTRNPHTCHIVVTVSPIIWSRATEQGRLRIDLQNVFVEDQSPLVQCSRCLGYGHGRRFCKLPADLCSHCGGPHLGASCPDRLVGESPKCINCKRAGKEDRCHNAFNKDCPVRRKWDDIARASTQYC